LSEKKLNSTDLVTVVDMLRFYFFYWWKLEQIPGLVERMAALMCVGDDAEEDGEEEEEEDATPKSPADVESSIAEAIAAAEEKGERLQWLELDELNITDADLHGLNLAAKCPVSSPLTTRKVRSPWLNLENNTNW